MKQDAKVSVAAGLKRVEGQVRGVQRMLEEDRYCIDLLTQIQAARAALHRLEETILKDHVTGCIKQAFTSGDADAQAAKVDELVEAIGRMTR